MTERNFLHKFHAHEHHTGHPKEDNIVAGHQYTSRIISGQFLCFVRPPHSGKRPQRRTEPGIQHIWILFYPAAAMWANGEILPRYDRLATVLAIPCRNT